MSHVRIATRKSPLALWQARTVAQALEATHEGLRCELLPMRTQGDRMLDAPLAKVGGKGLFVKELELAMIEGRADIAVHSMKDVPVALPGGLDLPVIMQRADPRDALVSGDHAAVDALPRGARVGTSSLRRQCQLRAYRPDLLLRNLRGGVGTRLAKLDEGEFDAIILAAAGLDRLGEPARIRERIEPSVMLPAIGQGVMGIECREDDESIRSLIAALEHGGTADCVAAERAMNARLEGGCQVPVAGHAVLDQDALTLTGRVVSMDGQQVVEVTRRQPRRHARQLGEEVGEALLAGGADAILREVFDAAARAGST